MAQEVLLCFCWLTTQLLKKLGIQKGVKVGIPEFLNGIGNGVESHVAKLEAEIGDFQKLLVTRTLKLKKLGVPCKHRKLILKYTHKYRLGLWRPLAQAIKS
ncbi:PREDICTED: IGR [Prunus dulcis]|uniref:PREDICTED: IGR n=1 Tax=Prunus dulcis TaxID=3755 RepID=A0A5E4FJH6_PRUDU|nr:PREDICTED: IGR [Prunus dulcis]